jgi:hypothetical protein
VSVSIELTAEIAFLYRGCRTRHNIDIVLAKLPADLKAWFENNEPRIAWDGEG